eukprot:937891-Heterocapsa_arctica.AAC.1
MANISEEQPENVKEFENYLKAEDELRKVRREVDQNMSQTEALRNMNFEKKQIYEMRQMIKVLGSQTHVSEIFCPPRFTQNARRFGLTAGLAFDLTVGWDLNNSKD